MLLGLLQVVEGQTVEIVPEYHGNRRRADLRVMHGAHLIAAIEIKSNVASLIGTNLQSAQKQTAAYLSDVVSDTMRDDVIGILMDVSSAYIMACSREYLCSAMAHDIDTYTDANRVSGVEEPRV